ncbi:hypothetical protein DFS33DRAFT_1260895, partial [Desarmillaria ectypa]
LPLSKPIVMSSGKVLHELHIPEGTYIVFSIPGYNRNKDIFGVYTHTFNPERWLDSDVKRNAKVSLEMYRNLWALLFWCDRDVHYGVFRFTFIGGPQSFFSDRGLDSHSEGIVPTLEGEVEKGAQLPLRVKTVPR